MKIPLLRGPGGASRPARQPRQPRQPGQRDAYKSFSAAELYCPGCGRAMPVREQLALYLPTGAIYHYRCTGCNAVLGKKEA